ncbi:hypothetical protein TNCV_4568231 [Trichonephila clavipes]|nr:hypothetical protein TNCV_4568231 [Trichonephila clavipes]
MISRFHSEEDDMPHSSLENWKKRRTLRSFQRNAFEDVQVLCRKIQTTLPPTGSSHSIAGDTSFFRERYPSEAYADGYKSEVEVYTTSVVFRLERRIDLSDA